jgi:hypothetical protein
MRVLAIDTGFGCLLGRHLARVLAALQVFPVKQQAELSLAEHAAG